MSRFNDINQLRRINSKDSNKGSNRGNKSSNIVSKLLSKKNKGRSLIELMSALFIFMLVTILITNIFANTMNHYFGSRKVDNSDVALYEALMYIDYYINFYGEKHYIEERRLYIEAQNGERKNYIYLFDSELRMAYKNETGSGYTSQPLLYEVREFNLSKNNRVTFIEVVTINGLKMKKAIGRI